MSTNGDDFPFRVKTDMELLTQPLISPYWVDYYLTISETPEMLMEKLSNSKTTRDVRMVVKKSGMRTVAARFIQNHSIWRTRANKKSCPSPEITWKLFNVTDNLDRLKFTLRASFPFFASVRPEHNGPITFACFDKNAFKAVYSTYLSFDKAKLQLAYKAMQKLEGLETKTGVTLGNVIGNLSMTIFKSSVSAALPKTHSALKLKYKAKSIEDKFSPSGWLNTIKAEQELFSAGKAKRHLKMRNLLYAKMSFLPTQSHFEISSDLIISNYDTGSLANRLGYKGGLDTKSEVGGTRILNYFYVKYNYYGLPVLYQNNVSVFGYFASLGTLPGYKSHEVGLGVEKYFERSRLRLQALYNLLKPSWQLRLAGE